MMRFNRAFGLIRYFGSAPKEISNIPKVQDLKENKQLRDRLHLKQFYTEADKSIFYEQSRVRRSTALYNLMAHLPTGAVKSFNKLFADQKVEIRSDNLYLPRISKNGVPIYDSLTASKLVILFRNFEAVIPLFYIFTLHFPGPMIISSAIFYIGIFRPVLQKFASSFVLKMELAPETEEILIQKSGAFGCINTSRVKIDDLEFCDRKHLDIFLYRFSRSWVDKNLIFRVKSTGELLFFDPEGYWYEEGLNHELLI